MISGLVDKLLNIDRWAHSPSWMIDFFSWLADRDQNNMANKAVMNSPEFKAHLIKAAGKLTEASDLCKKAGFDRYSNPAEVKEYMDDLPAYKEYMQLCKEEETLMGEINKQARVEFEQKFDNVDTFTKYVSERFEVYKKQCSEFGRYQLEDHKSELEDLYHMLESTLSEPL
jgi:hypothetical protein